MQALNLNQKIPNKLEEERQNPEENKEEIHKSNEIRGPTSMIFSSTKALMTLTDVDKAHYWW